MPQNMGDVLCLYEDKPIAGEGMCDSLRSLLATAEALDTRRPLNARGRSVLLQLHDSADPERLPSLYHPASCKHLLVTAEQCLRKAYNG